MQISKEQYDKLPERLKGYFYEGNFHCTVKSLSLMQYLVKLISREGQTVLDPFTGSGTTGMACKKMGRGFIGIEREAGYCEIAEKRIKSVGEQKEKEEA